MIQSATATRPTPNEIAQAMTGRPYISYSEVRTFQSCPLKWQFQYVDKAKPEQLPAAMLLGSAVHAAVERHFEAMLAAMSPPTVEQLMESFFRCWKKEAEDVPVQYSKGQDADTMAATGRRMLERFVDSPLARPDGEIIGIEESFRVRLGEHLPDLAGRVDMITYHPEQRELVITDFKTARSIWSQDHAEEQAEQLILYAQGCEPIARDLNATIKLRYIVVTKTKQPRVDALTVPFDANRTNRTKSIIHQVFRAMQTGITYPVPSPMNCTGCGYRERCNASSDVH